MSQSESITSSSGGHTPHSSPTRSFRRSYDRESDDFEEDQNTYLSPPRGFNLPTLPITTSLDEDLANDSRLAAIFSQGIVVYESRLETEPTRDHQPIVLLDEMLSKTHDVRENFDQPSKQRELFIDAAKERSRFSYAGTSFDLSKNESLLDHIQETTSRPLKRVKIGNHVLSLI